MATLASDSHSDGENPGPSKRMKTSKKAGAAAYRTKFNHSWTKTWPFVREVKGDPYKFMCTTCGAYDQGKRDVERHIGKAMHQANSKSLGQSTINFSHNPAHLMSRSVKFTLFFEIILTNIIGYTCRS
jgi:hypothetical protein